MWSDRAARYAEIVGADAVVVALPHTGGVSIFAAHGVAAPLGPALRRVLAGAIAAPVSVPIELEARLADGRVSQAALVRRLVWEGRTVGVLAALRAEAWPGMSGPPIDALGRLAALDLYQSYRDLHALETAPSTSPPPPAALAVTPPPARRRPLLVAVLATGLAQLLGVDAGLAYLAGPVQGAVDAAALATVLAAAVQVLALAALRGDRWLRALLVALLVTFVAAGIGILGAVAQLTLAEVRAGETVLALGTAVLAARVLRSRARAARPAAATLGA